ncbi:mucin-5AC isoform X1 [Astyanax mexicanus]|uniref:mucin-5AC isoform X1 n=1 Tax=Astyanax mexicanus TaxID=7994 RepID=UPI0020CAA86F|nr:mucin-5AC isoform X1 [Astyanax mexicanus]
MFGSVRKLVSAFETRKQPRHLHLPSGHASCPNTSSVNPPHGTPTITDSPSLVQKTVTSPSPAPAKEPLLHNTSGHTPSTWSRPPSTPPIPHSLLSRSREGDAGFAGVTLRGNGTKRKVPRVRLRDSWPAGRQNVFSSEATENKEPSFNRGRLRLTRFSSRPLSDPSLTPFSDFTTSITGLKSTSPISGSKSTSTFLKPSTSSIIRSKSTSATETTIGSITGPKSTSTTKPTTSFTTRPKSTSTIRPTSSAITELNPTPSIQNSASITRPHTDISDTSAVNRFSASEFSSLKAQAVCFSTGPTSASRTSLTGSSTSGPSLASAVGWPTEHTNSVVYATNGTRSNCAEGSSSSSITGIPCSISDIGNTVSSKTGIEAYFSTGTSPSSATETISGSSNVVTTASPVMGTNGSSAIGISSSSTVGPILGTNANSHIVTATSSMIEINANSGIKASSSSTTGTTDSSCTEVNTASTMRGTNASFPSNFPNRGQGLPRPGPGDVPQCCSQNRPRETHQLSGYPEQTLLSSACCASVLASGSVLVSSANQSQFETPSRKPGAPVSPEHLHSASRLTAASLASNRKRGWEKGVCRKGLRHSDSTFASLLLFLRSGSSNSMIAIDNKIEQAMDLVKAHLMLAVREEVEILREQIKELSERNAQLERENYILRALKDPH